LTQFVESISQHCVEIGAIHVVYAASTAAHQEAYNKVGFELLTPSVTLHNEAKSSFRETLLALLNSLQKSWDHLLLAVDDALVVQQLDVATLSRAFSNPRLWCMHLKLHPSVEFCHPADRICRLPKLTYRWRGSLSGSFVTWPAHASGNLEWAYPWDLCCTLYRTKHVARLLEQLRSGTVTPAALGHPNTLEAAGNVALRGKALGAFMGVEGGPLLAAPARPSVVCITVNRVQEVYRNAVFTCDAPSSADALLSKAGGGQGIHGAWYAPHSFSSVHIGHLQLTEQHSQPAHSMPVDAVNIDVLLPVYNAAASIEQALLSVLHQEGGGWPGAPPLNVHVITVDDGSTDDSWGVLRGLAQSLGADGAPSPAAVPPSALHHIKGGGCTAPQGGARVSLQSVPVATPALLTP
jgi:hypothetical protein